jgi:DNA-directed RNA polymerase subunit RPC12/RpoP
MVAQDQIPSFSIEPETPTAIPMAQPVVETKPKGEEFQCPECSKIFIVALEKRPLHIKCPYCGLEGIVD